MWVSFTPALTLCLSHETVIICVGMQIAPERASCAQLQAMHSILSVDYGNVKDRNNYTLRCGGFAQPGIS